MGADEVHELIHVVKRALVVASTAATPSCDCDARNFQLGAIWPREPGGLKSPSRDGSSPVGSGTCGRSLGKVDVCLS